MKSLPRKSTYKIDYKLVAKLFPFEGSVVGRAAGKARKPQPGKPSTESKPKD